LKTRLRFRLANWRLTQFALKFNNTRIPSPSSIQENADGSLENADGDVYAAAKVGQNTIQEKPGAVSYGDAKMNDLEMVFAFCRSCYSA
jgi:hypothetical protein